MKIARRSSRPGFLRAFVSLASALLFSLPLSAADREFSIPLSTLKLWSQSVTTSLNVEILGHSKVHSVASDCEMHFGAKVPGYAGDPPGWVLEPMNLCLEPFPGKATASKKDWEDLGQDLVGAKVRADGVPRIWPEHLVGGGDSNPNHAVELHPMVRLQRGNHVFEFAKFVYAPDGLDGISEKTIRSILTDSEVNVTEKDGNVEINLDAGTIGNFAIVQLAVIVSTIKELDGGFRMNGEVVLGRKERIPVALVAVKDSEFGKAVDQLRSSHRKKVALEALVLFSLNPEALYQAAKDSHGNEVMVPNPIQLIVYGDTASHD